MANNKKINVTELDFDNIKSNLKTFLSGQTEFQDYDFEGSAMSVLLDVLAYNTHYNALYNNMAINEMFLDSARKRNSIVSLSKMLGYTPRSATCAKAIVTVNVSTGSSSPAAVSIPAYQEFTTTIDGKQYTFYNTGSITTTISENGYVFSDVEITEGKPLNYKYTVSDGMRYIIPNANVDIKTLKIRVQENASSSVYETWNNMDSVVNATSVTKAFWVKEIDDGLYEVNFGDGNIGRALETGNVVHMDYFVSSLEAANGARTFSYNGATILGGAQVSVTTTGIASNGADKESNDSIRFNAPKFYAAQNRAVTPDDYKALIYANVPEAKSVSVWGGEDNNPPVYGKTFICIKPRDATKLTTVQKAAITSSILTNRNVVSVIPEIVDPEYINIALNIAVYYNEQETTKTAAEISTLVRQTVVAYNDSELQTFDGVFRHSKLSRLIDETDPSIVNSVMTVLLRRKLTPRYNVSAQYLLNMINPIHYTGLAEESFKSTGFYIAGSDQVHYLDDDGVRYVRLYRLGTNATKIIVNDQIGTIDYTKGIVDIKNLHITALADVDFELSIAPQSYDVVSALTQVAEVALDHMYITAIADKTASGDLRGGYNYQFTSSRS
jgi:hypothetical protein